LPIFLTRTGKENVRVRGEWGWKEKWWGRGRVKGKGKSKRKGSRKSFLQLFMERKE
jgi:hypothetical protein